MSSQLSKDTASLLKRRGVIAGLGAAGLVVAGGALLARRGGGRGPFGQSVDDVVAKNAAGENCVALPPETNGPFPADGTNGRRGTINVLGEKGLLRSDIRPCFGEMKGETKGVPLELEFMLVNVDAACAPLSGHALYLWQCDANGDYSLYSRTDVNYLRGLQVSDAQGKLRFQTIFPACYDGRWPHLHFEVFQSATDASSGEKAILTSQFALPAEACAAVYQDQAVYPGSAEGYSGLSPSTDMVFANNSGRQLAAQTLKLTGDVRSGFQASASIGLTAQF